MDLRLYSQQLTDIYVVSNTPSFLYEKLKQSPIVNDILAKVDKEKLFDEFQHRISNPINKQSEIAELYAVLIAISFKSGEDIVGFFRSVKDSIKYEWFSKIAEFCLSQQSANNTFTYSVNPSSHFDITVPSL